LETVYIYRRGLVGSNTRGLTKLWFYKIFIWFPV